MNRVITSVGLTAGGTLAAAFLSMSVAGAAPGDSGNGGEANMFGLTPASAIDITSQTGEVYQNVAYGTQTFDFNSNDMTPWIANFLTKHVTFEGNPISFDSDNPVTVEGFEAAVIDKIWFGGFAEQQILFPAIDNTNIDGGVIDIHHFGPIGYIYIDLVGPGNIGPNHDAVGTWLVTPIGTFDVSSWEDGTFFGGLAYLESELFDLSNFNPGADFSEAALTPVPSIFDIFNF